MMNGTFAPPLAGEYFMNAWLGRTVRMFYDRARTMPPAAPGSLPSETYLNIVAYILQVNGVKPGSVKLEAGGEDFDRPVTR
jgi:hypothetical protein